MILLRQYGYELLKLYARKRTYIGYGAFVLVQLAILSLLQLPHAKRAVSDLLENNGYAFADFYGGLTLAVVMIVFTFMLLGALYLALVAGDIIAKEVEDGTMRLVLARPVSRLRLLTVKWLACTTYTFTLIIFLSATALTAATIYRGHLGKLFIFVQEERLFAIFDTGPGLRRYLLATLLLTLTTQIISNAAFMFSCFKMKPAAATILTLSALFVDLVLQSIPYFHSYREYFITYHTTCWVRVFRDPIPWWSIERSLIYLGALNLTMIIIGAMRFSTRDLKN